MESLALFLSLGAVALVIGGYFWLIRWYQRSRAADYQRHAVARGFQFQAERPGAEERYAAVVKMFTQGHGHHWRDEMSGQIDGSPFSAFEYVYTTGYGKGSSTYKCAMIHWPSAQRDFPRFALAPETFFDRVGQVLAYRILTSPRTSRFRMAQPPFTG